MISYETDGRTAIRAMRETDVKILCDEENRQGWHQTEEKYRKRLADCAAGKSIALVAEYNGKAAGYINVYLDAVHVGGKGFCKIVDLGVLEKFRNKGIGTKLMDAAERAASAYADTVFLEVGLHAGYGSAQRMYAKRGYIPDGKGVWYGEKLCEPYTVCRNDDELTLHLSRKLI